MASRPGGAIVYPRHLSYPDVVQYSFAVSPSVREALLVVKVAFEVGVVQATVSDSWAEQPRRSSALPV